MVVGVLQQLRELRGVFNILSRTPTDGWSFYRPCGRSQWVVKPRHRQPATSNQFYQMPWKNASKNVYRGFGLQWPDMPITIRSHIFHSAVFIDNESARQNFGFAIQRIGYIQV